LTSYPVEDIVARARLLLERGKKEIYLTAQDTGCYGLDIHSNLVELLKEILKIDGDYRLRIGMMNPNYALKMLNELIGIYRDDRVYKFLHIPVQSGSDRVIREMNRGYTTAQFEKIADRFREELEDICLSTDIIVGFPTETDADFKKTVELIKIVRPDIINVSKFYPRPNTAAARMKLLTTETLKKRSVALSKVCRKIILEQNKKYIGQVMECLVTDRERKLARAHNFKQVFLDRRAAGFVHAKIMDASHSCLKGEINK
jgi:MiaB/RimO family radical SAM methylthiotransferase